MKVPTVRPKVRFAAAHPIDRPILCNGSARCTPPELGLCSRGSLRLDGCAARPRLAVSFNVHVKYFNTCATTLGRSGGAGDARAVGLAHGCCRPRSKRSVCREIALAPLRRIRQRRRVPERAHFVSAALPLALMCPIGNVLALLLKVPKLVHFH
jgi:hypothetical protein